MIKELLKEYSYFPFGNCDGCPNKITGCHSGLRPQIALSIKIPLIDENRWSHCRNYSCEVGRNAAASAIENEKKQPMRFDDETVMVVPFGTEEKPNGRFVSDQGIIYSNNGKGSEVYPTGQIVKRNMRSGYLKK